MSLSRERTRAVLPVCLNAFYNEGDNQNEVRMALQRFRDSDFQMIHFVPTFAPGWERRGDSSGRNLASPWWVLDIPRYGRDKNTWLHDSVRDAIAFFQASAIYISSHI